MTDEKQADPYMDVLDELRDLTLKKRAGYSPGDDPFANFRMTEMFKVPCKCGCRVATPIPPIFGIMIREMDKISRIASLLANPDNDRVGESLRDTMMDSGNYPLIGVAMTDQDKKAKMEQSVQAKVDAITGEIDKARMLDHAIPKSIFSGPTTGEIRDMKVRNSMRRRFGPDPEDVRYDTVEDLTCEVCPCDTPGCFDCAQGAHIGNRK